MEIDYAQERILGHTPNMTKKIIGSKTLSTLRLDFLDPPPELGPLWFYFEGRKVWGSNQSSVRSGAGQALTGVNVSPRASHRRPWEAQVAVHDTPGGDTPPRETPQRLGEKKIDVGKNSNYTQTSFILKKSKNLECKYDGGRPAHFHVPARVENTHLCQSRMRKIRPLHLPPMPPFAHRGRR